MPPTKAIEDIQWLPQRSSQPGKTTPSSLVLKAGDQLSASVLDVIKGNDALLAIGQFKAYARLPLPVVTGQDIRLRVEVADQGLRMVLLPKTDTAANLAAPDNLEIRLFEPSGVQAGAAKRRSAKIAFAEVRTLKSRLGQVRRAQSRL